MLNENKLCVDKKKGNKLNREASPYNGNNIPNKKKITLWLGFFSEATNYHKTFRKTNQRERWFCC